MLGHECRACPRSQASRTRNPVAQFLALAVLGVALIGAAIMGAVVFAVLLGVFAVGYLVSLAHAWWRLFRLRRRAAFADATAPAPAQGRLHRRRVRGRRGHCGCRAARLGWPGVAHGGADAAELRTIVAGDAACG